MDLRRFGDMLLDPRTDIGQENRVKLDIERAKQHEIKRRRVTNHNTRRRTRKSIRKLKENV